MSLAKKATRESAIERHLVDEVRKRGGDALKQTGTVGIPDRLVLAPAGQAVFVELKRPGGGVLSAAQFHMIERLRKLGHRVELIDSKGGVEGLVQSLTWGVGAPGTRGSFAGWLLDQSGRDDPIGDLSRDVIDDAGFPKAGSLEACYRYLAPRASEEALLAMHHAALEWAAV